MKNPALIRNVAVIGHLHHGKTRLLDIIVSQVLGEKSFVRGRHTRFTDARKDEQERLVSIKSTPFSCVLENSKGKNFLVNLMDTPGHLDFSDEMCTGIRLSDGAVLVVDAIEGMMLGTERALKYIVQEGKSLCVVISKVDRLVLEMKIPPSDAYLKLKHIIEEMNGVLSTEVSKLGKENCGIDYELSPLKNNVIFGCNEYEFFFSLDTFAGKYADRFPAVRPDIFRKVLWGNYFFNKETRKIERKRSSSDMKRTFVEFVLEPVYKILAHTVSFEKDKLEKTLRTL